MKDNTEKKDNAEKKEAAEKTGLRQPHASELKEAITERGEKTLAEILLCVREFRARIASEHDAQSEAAARNDAQAAAQAAAQNGVQTAAQNGDEGLGIYNEADLSTVEYRAPVIIFGEELQADRKRKEQEPGGRDAERRRMRASNTDRALFGKSRAEQLEIIRLLSDEAAEELPERFYEKLSGGIALSEQKKYHPKSQRQRPLLILGEYRNDPRMGRSIMLYGGSIIESYAHLSRKQLKAELRRIIRHEFTHHIESLCGERGLEIEDELNLERYEWENSGIFSENGESEVK